MDKAEKVMNLAIRRGFFWPAYEIYGGIGGMYVWGPHGIVLKNKIKNLWRTMFVEAHNFLEIDGPSIAPYIVFDASGHVTSFKDVMVTCSSCNRKYRADTLLKERGIEIKESATPRDVDEIVVVNDVRCPNCGGKFDKSSYFITMFRTNIGPYSESDGFLRPETAQNIFVEFKRIYEVFRRRFPVGIAQIGRGFRNEISPRQGPIRLREFDMMELEYFFDPEDEGCEFLDDDILDDELNILHERLMIEGNLDYETITVREALEKGIISNGCMAYFMFLATRFLEVLGIPRDKIRFKEKLEGERAHYAIQTFDQEVKLSRWGWIEVSGHAYRTDFDLSAHIKMSGRDLRAYRRLKRPKVVEVVEIKPRVNRIKEDFSDKIGVIMRELAKLDRDVIRDSVLSKGYLYVGGVKLDKGYFEIKSYRKRLSVEPFVPHVVEPSFGLDRICYSVLEYAYKEVGDRVVLSLPPYIAPYDAAVYPLINTDQLVRKALRVLDLLSSEGFKVLYDEGESIGRRYARGDEIGVPVAFTIDHQSIEDDSITVRDRDTWKQYRIDISEIKKFLVLIIEGTSFDGAAKELGLKIYKLRE